MGDRSNVVLLLENRGADPTPLYLYSHWGGKGFQTTDLAAALSASRDRWSDDPYFTRNIITRIFANLPDTTGGGIGLELTDNDGYPLTVVDRATETVFRVYAANNPLDVAARFDVLSFSAFITKHLH